MRNIHFFLLLFTFHHSFLSFSQEIPASTQQQLENLADADGAETEDVAWLEEMEHFRKDPLNLNAADAEDLKQLKILSDLQIARLISYRDLLGKFLSVYELQSIPAWDIITIRKLLPFIWISDPLTLKEEWKTRFREGEHSFLFRISQVLERAAGYQSPATEKKYKGNPQHILFRYRYSYKNVLQYGLLGDKDAGERFFRGAQRTGFDFYSIHFFARKKAFLQTVALGDYTVNMGQGLLQWQSLAFKKSAEAISIKRQSAILRPYSSSGEFNFFRGVGITIRKRKIESTAFFSIRKLSSNLVADTINNEAHVSSFLNSGYHRTEEELKDRNNLRQTSFGGNISLKEKRWHVGLNAVYYSFSLPVNKDPEPYNLYAIKGNSWYNMGIDYDYSFRNLHFFGEAAIDRNLNKAFLNGLLMSVDPRADIALLYRSISSAYQAVNGNAFTENTYPGNERGWYAGICLRPSAVWKLDAYIDLFKFPWLKYRVDAPGFGKEMLIQLLYIPDKKTEMYVRWKSQSKQGNQTSIYQEPGTENIHYLVLLPRQSLRVQTSIKIDKAFTIRNRAEILWYDKRGANDENGFLFYSDIIYKPLLKPYSGIIRFQYFETEGYNSRVYAFENDVLYSFSIPAFSGNGFRYYFTLNYDICRKISIWIRCSQTAFPGSISVGEGADQVLGTKKSELKVQCRWLL